MPRTSRAAPALLLLAAAIACTDAPTAAPGGALLKKGAQGAGGGSGSEGRGVFHRYVAVGTSVSEGWRSDGVLAASQETSWPAQLARLAHRELTVPRIAFPGCGAPLAAPSNGWRWGPAWAPTPAATPSRTAAPP